MGADIKSYIFTKKNFSIMDADSIYNIRLKEEIDKDKEDPTSHFYDNSGSMLDNKLCTSNYLHIYPINMWNNGLFEHVLENKELFKECVIIEHSDEGDSKYSCYKVNKDLLIAQLPCFDYHDMLKSIVDLYAFCMVSNFIKFSDLLEFYNKYYKEVLDYETTNLLLIEHKNSLFE